MSDFDAKDIISEDTLPTGNDFHEDDIHEIVSPSVSKSESALKGAEQGLTLGFADELGGGLEAGLDVGQALLNKLGLVSPSPSQVGEQLASQGFTGDTGPASTLEMYRQARDQSRKEYEAAQQANPGNYLAGNIGGGLLLGGGLGQVTKAGGMAGQAASKFMAPLGEVAPEAGLLQKMATGAINTLPTGVAVGTGMSNADLTQGQIAPLAEDITTSAELGGLIGGGIPLVGAGLKSLSGVVPENVKHAFKKGLEGINTSSQEFYDDVTQRLRDLTGKVSTPINEQVEQQVGQHGKNVSELEYQLANAQEKANKNVAATKENLVSQKASEVSNIESQLSSLENETKKALELGKAKQAAQNADEITALNKETVDNAKKIQNQVFNVKKDLGKQFDEIDKAAEATGITPENRDIIGDFQEKLTNMSGLPENEVNTIMKKMLPSLGKKDIQSFRNLKQILSNYFEHANPVVRRVAKEAYSNLKNNYANELRGGGYDELANKLSVTNKRWSAAIDLEDKFLSNLKPNRITGEIEASPDTIRAVGNFAEKTPVQMAESDYLSKLLNTLHPEEAPQTIRQLEDLGQRSIQAKAAPTAVPELPNPEATRLQQLLEQAKGTKIPEVPELPNAAVGQLEQSLQQAKATNPTNIPGLDLPTGDKTQLENQLLQTLPKYGMKSGSDIAEKKLDQVFSFLKEKQGPEMVNTLKAKLSDLNKDIQLRNLSDKGIQDGIPTSVAQAVNKVVSHQASKLGNAAGRQIYQSKQFLENGIKALSNADGNTMQQLANKMASTGTEGAKFAKVLSDSITKTQQSRNAIIFGLMQQPEFRKLFHQANGGQNNEKP